MMEVEMKSTKVICSRCGKMFSKYRNFFPVSYAAQHKGTGFLPICKECADRMYEEYLSQCGDPKMAVRQMCRKLDLYWDDEVYEVAIKRSAPLSAMTKYMSKLTSNAYAGKCYDDTLIIEGSLWSYPSEQDAEDVDTQESEDKEEPVSEDIVMFWGEGYTPNMYRKLEKRKDYWIERLPKGVDIDIGTEAIIKQICSLELDINRDRAAGKPVDKTVGILNTLLGSARLKPDQKKEDLDSSINNTPFGVWIYRFEHKRPIPDKYPDSTLLKYVFTWMGHVLKMLGVKNKYEELYERTMEKYRVEKPEYTEDDDEEFLSSVMNDAPDWETNLDTESDDFFDGGGQDG